LMKQKKRSRNKGTDKLNTMLMYWGLARTLVLSTVQRRIESLLKRTFKY